MTEERKSVCIGKKCLHPRVKEVLEEIAPPSPMAVPRDSSQPRAGNLLNIHRGQFLLVPNAQKPHNDKPEVTLSLESSLLRRRKQR